MVQSLCWLAWCIAKKERKKSDEINSKLEQNDSNKNEANRSMVSTFEYANVRHIMQI